jgi:hypothetical protein
MYIELTAPQISTLLDALEQWEDGMDIEMQGDELDEARKDIHALRGVLIAALAQPEQELINLNKETT